MEWNGMEVRKPRRLIIISLPRKQGQIPDTEGRAMIELIRIGEESQG